MDWTIKEMAAGVSAAIFFGLAVWVLWTDKLESFDYERDYDNNDYEDEP